MSQLNTQNTMNNSADTKVNEQPVTSDQKDDNVQVEEVSEVSTIQDGNNEKPEEPEEPEDKLPEGVKPEAFEVAKSFTNCNDVKTNMYNTYRRSQLHGLFKLWSDTQPSTGDSEKDDPNFSNVLYAMANGLNLLKVGGRNSIRWTRNDNRRPPAPYIPRFTSSKSGDVDPDALELAKSFTNDVNVRPNMFITYHRQQLNALYRLWVDGQEETEQLKNTEF